MNIYYLLGLILMLSACNKNSGSSEVQEEDNTTAFGVNAFVDLPPCNHETSRQLAWVDFDRKLYYCNGLSWVERSLTETNKEEPEMLWEVEVLKTLDTRCNTGGVLIKGGIDENQNGKLELSEAKQQHPVCNGKSGENGLDYDRKGYIVTTVPAEDGDCPVKGKRLQYGIDHDGDGVLTSSNEILNDPGLLVCSQTDTKVEIEKVTCDSGDGLKITRLFQKHTGAAYLPVGDPETICLDTDSETRVTEHWTYKDFYITSDDQVGVTGQYEVFLQNIDYYKKSNGESIIVINGTSISPDTGNELSNNDFSHTWIHTEKYNPYPSKKFQIASSSIKLDYDFKKGTNGPAIEVKFIVGIITKNTTTVQLWEE